MKKYKTGLVLGRFQTFHKGHEYIINKALEICSKVLVFIGSSDKDGTQENPFSYELRKKLIKKIYENEIKTYVEKHFNYTGSVVAKKILNNWEAEKQNFKVVIAPEFKEIFERGEA